VRLRRGGVRELAGKHVFVTGAGSGIGRAVARLAADHGALLHLTDVNAEALTDVAAQIRAAGGTVLTDEAFDVSDYEAVRDFASRLTASQGAMDVLMNVAGISTWGTVQSLEHHHWRRLVDVNLMGPIHVIETLLPPMIDAGRGGHLVNVSSAAGLIGLPWHAAYSATKFGIRGVSEVLRFDLARHRIGVSLVVPGGVDTGLVQTLHVAGVDSTDPRFTRLRKHFQSRAVSPEAAAVAILDGVRRGRYLIYTSHDIRAAYLLQRWFPPGYVALMKAFNTTANRVFPAVGAARRTDGDET
jgi:NAD(P)-dependent dehydrogenase (short-subunit alcohol dehydrogenase family)